MIVALGEVADILDLFVSAEGEADRCEESSVRQNRPNLKK